MAACDHYLELISQRLDTPLAAHETAALDDHLLQCTACRALCDEFAQIAAALSALGESAPPAGFSGAVLKKIRLEKTTAAKPGLSARRRWQRLAAIAACGIVVTGLTQWYAQIHGGASTGSATPEAAVAPFSAATYAAQGAQAATVSPADGLDMNSAIPAAPEAAPPQTGVSSGGADSFDRSADFQPWHSEPSQTMLAIHQDFKTRQDNAALQLLFFSAEQHALLPDSPHWQQSGGYEYLETDEQTFHALMQTADWANLLAEADGGYYLVVME